MAHHSYILLKGEGRGMLLGKRYNGGYEEHSHRLTSETMIMYPFPDEDVAPLTKEECVLLDAIDSLETCFTVYSSPWKLKWGLGLKVGDTVLARLPDKGDGCGSSGNVQWGLGLKAWDTVFAELSDKRDWRGSSGSVQYATAIIRWCGEVDCRLGSIHKIGVEIMEPQYRGYGDKDGTVYPGKCHEKKCFACERNCGLFLTLAELEKPPSSNGTSSVSTQEHTSQLEREPAAKTQETCHLQQQLSTTERRLQEQGRQMATLQGEVRRERETVARLQGEVRRERETVARLQGEVREKTETVVRLQDESSESRREGKQKVNEDQVAELLSAKREKLKIAVTLDMTWLADKMHGAGLLPDNVHKDVTNARSMLTEDQKATEIIEALEKLVCINPRNYLKFVDILKKKPIYSDVTELMQ